MNDEFEIIFFIQFYFFQFGVKADCKHIAENASDEKGEFVEGEIIIENMSPFIPDELKHKKDVDKQLLFQQFEVFVDRLEKGFFHDEIEEIALKHIENYYESEK